MKFLRYLFFCYCLFGVARAEVLLFSQEAEQTVVHPLSKIDICDTCSGQGLVRYIGWSERWVQFNVVVQKTGFYTTRLWLLQHSPVKAIAALKVNGSQQSMFWVRPTDMSKTLVDQVDVQVFLKTGQNSIAYGNYNDWAMDLDRIDLLELQNKPEVEYILKPLTPILGVITWRDWDGVLILGIGTVCGFMTLLLLWKKRLEWAAHVPLMLVVIILCIAAMIFQALDLIDDSLAGSILWRETRILSTLFFITGTYFFALRYTGNQVLLNSKFTRAWLVIIVCIPLYMLVTYLTGTGYSQDWWLNPRVLWLDLGNDRRSVFDGIVTSYQSLTASLTLMVLTIFYGRVSSVYRSQLIMVIASGSLSFLFGMTFSSVVSELGWKRGPIYVYTFPFTLVFLFIAIWRFRLGTLSPEIWGESAQLQASAIIAVNRQGQVVESNDLAKTIFRVKIDAPLQLELNQTSERIFWNERYYQQQMLPLREDLGRIHVLNDITELHQAQTTLEARNQELFVTNNELEQAQSSLQLINIDLSRSNNQLETLQLELREQAIRDKLTGLYNRRYLDQALHDWAQEKYQFSVMLLDVDRFREYNSRFGFNGGDAVLKAIGNFLLQTLPSSFLSCRYGGEEFCILMPLSHLDGLVKAQNIQQQFSELEVIYKTQVLRLTVSSSFASTEKYGSELLLFADETLRLAKQRGRNQLLEANAPLPVWTRGWV
jgi:diguanylate cyclase (GGDEF)-like protein